MKQAEQLRETGYPDRHELQNLILSIDNSDYFRAEEPGKKVSNSA